MKLFICLVTPDERLRAYFGKGKSAVIPPEVFTRGPLAKLGLTPMLLAWTPGSPVGRDDLEKFLLDKARNHHACLVFVDTAWEAYAAEIRDAAFVVPFDGAAITGSLKNFFFGLSARALRNMAQMLAKFASADDAQLLALPLRNFRADALVKIARLCRDAPLSGALSTDVDRCLFDLRRRVRPRQKSKYKTRYAVDDVPRFFKYGMERHAQFATGNPHRPSCEMAGLFRFGARLDERRHYNVSETEGDVTTVSGGFVDCHDSAHTVPKRSHLNMFTNDYF